MRLREANPQSHSKVRCVPQRAKEMTLPNGVKILPAFTNGQMTQAQVVSPLNALLAQVNLYYDSRGRVFKAEVTSSTTGMTTPPGLVWCSCGRTRRRGVWRSGWSLSTTRQAGWNW